MLEGIYFYNFTSPEFNVNVSQLPFWALSILFSYRCIKLNQTKDYIFLGIFLGLGVLSKYLFIYLASGIYLSFFYFFLNEKKDKLLNVLLSGIIFLIILMPHLFWLSQNDFSTISYGFKRTGGVGDLTDHLI